jgi:nucleosome binding factor SPN SPT16 subunit
VGKETSSHPTIGARVLVARRLAATKPPANTLKAARLSQKMPNKRDRTTSRKEGRTRKQRKEKEENAEQEKQNHIKKGRTNKSAKKRQRAKKNKDRNRTIRRK